MALPFAGWHRCDLEVDSGRMARPTLKGRRCSHRESSLPGDWFSPGKIRVRRVRSRRSTDGYATRVDTMAGQHESPDVGRHVHRHLQFGSLTVAVDIKFDNQLISGRA